VVVGDAVQVVKELTPTLQHPGHTPPGHKVCFQGRDLSCLVNLDA
jgi:hypothetical protein